MKVCPWSATLLHVELDKRSAISVDPSWALVSWALVSPSRAKLSAVSVNPSWALVSPSPEPPHATR